MKKISSGGGDPGKTAGNARLDLLYCMQSGDGGDAVPVFAGSRRAMAPYEKIIWIRLRKEGIIHGGKAAVCLSEMRMSAL